MSTKIEWTDTTWNPTTGCDRISDGCDNCYALTLAKRLKGMGSAKYQNDGDPRTSGPGFGLTIHPDTLNDPYTWKKPRTVFVNSMSDLFHARVPFDFIRQVFDVMEATPQHTYQILTKRPSRLPRLAGKLPWPSNVWMGTSVENQQEAVRRIRDLFSAPAAVHFLSCEPLLGPVDLASAACRGDERGHGLTASAVHAGGCCAAAVRRLDWVIVGGESGLKARPMHPDWARSLRDQCQAADVPFFFKQYGSWAPVGPDEKGCFRHGDREIRRDGYCWPITEPHGAEDGTEVTIRRVGKKAAGRLLDGREHNDMPNHQKVSQPA
ncbi:phage Gp37/Gp68 family protein [Actinopolymorpha sp. B17G11]|uniref:DUF5131 family protein n=1 Tax=Actinopolymorpha sp. B17G11 TaxID=3160861 RepID=UPI0032E36E2A